MTQAAAFEAQLPFDYCLCGGGGHVHPTFEAAKASSQQASCERQGLFFLACSILAHFAEGTSATSSQSPPSASQYFCCCEKYLQAAFKCLQEQYPESPKLVNFLIYTNLINILKVKSLRLRNCLANFVDLSIFLKHDNCIKTASCFLACAVDFSIF